LRLLETEFFSTVEKSPCFVQHRLVLPSFIMSVVYSLPVPSRHGLAAPRSSVSSPSIYYGQDSSMMEEARRKKSFVLFPQWSKAKPAALIDAGFYYTGDDDLVKCPECKLTYRDWSSLDDPAEVHLRLKSNCSLIRRLASASSSSSEGAGGSHIGTRRRAQRNRRRNGRDQHSDPHVFHLQTDGPNEGALLQNAGQVPNVNKEAAIIPRSDKRRNNINPEDINPYESSLIKGRIDSFAGKWPKESPMIVEDLAKAGFVYKGPDDKVQCVYCRGIIYRWEAKDTALGEHARHFPDCAFVAKVTSESPRLQFPAAQVLLNMGYDQSKVEQVLDLLEKEGVMEPTTDDIVDALFTLEDKFTEMESQKLQEKRRESTSSSQGGSETAPVSDEVLKLREENQKLKDSNTCKVCLDTPVETLLLPCRHLVTCSECANKVSVCPMCRVKIIGTVRTYFS